MTDTSQIERVGQGRGGATPATNYTYAPVTTVDGFHAVEALQLAVWQFEPLDAAPLNVLLTAQKNGGIVIGAHAPGGEMVGFVFGFLGAQAGRLRHCSHMAGVLPGQQHAGVGEQLKWRQLDAVRQQGLTDLITWTVDPLQAPNAHLNIRKLGGIARTYTENLYGVMTDSLNAGSDTDRITVEWWIDTPRVTRARAGVVVHPTWEQLIAQGAVEVSPDAGSGTDAAAALAAGVEIALVEIPADIFALKATDPVAVARWRAGVRAGLQAFFAAGWAITDFVRQSGPAGRRGAYVLQPEAALNLPPRLKV